MSSERTTKYVTITLKATFHGDYLAEDEVVAALEGWLDGGLNDRDDLRSWELGTTKVMEVHGDPEGFDS